MMSAVRSHWKSRRRFGRALVACAILATGAALLSGCSSGGVLGDRLPVAVGGLPQDAPARPAEGNYPAVHNMPPARSDTTLNGDQQRALADDLIAARNRYSSSPATNSSAGGAANP